MGEVILRIPRDLHKKLDILAEQNGVDLEQYMIYLISSNQTVASLSGQHSDEGIEHRWNYKKNGHGQDFNSGRRGNEVGRLIGQAVAEKLNMELQPGSNKGEFRGKRVVIKSARLGNSLFGITNKMVEEIDSVILAREIREGQFELYISELNNIKDKGRPTRSKGASSGKVTSFSVSEIIKNGYKFDEIKIDLPYPPNCL